MESVRLNKYLAQCGICSRREADQMIGEGRVVVDGVVAKTGMKLDGTERVLVDGKMVTPQEGKVVLLYHKPVGVVCTKEDIHAKRTLSTEIDYPIRVTYAGRLDKDSRGLLLLTNDGDLIDQMMRGRNEHEKEYHVEVNKEVTPDFLKKMSQGVYLKELEITTRKCEVRKTGRTSFVIVLTQGVNRQIRRMCDALGYRVKDLFRTRVVNLEIGRIPEGQFREATQEEIKALQEALKKENERNIEEE